LESLLSISPLSLSLSLSSLSSSLSPFSSLCSLSLSLFQVGASAARDSLQHRAVVSSIRDLARVAGRAVVDQLLLADLVNAKVP
jgi:hypothetical protein